MKKAKPITKEEVEQRNRDKIISLLMNGSAKQAVCIVATLANKSKDFEEFKKYLNSFAAECKKEINNEKK